MLKHGAVCSTPERITNDAYPLCQRTPALVTIPDSKQQEAQATRPLPTIFAPPISLILACFLAIAFRMVAGPITVGPKPPRRHEHAAVALDKHLWLFGGSTDGGFLEDVWTFAPDHAQWASLRPSGGHSSRHVPPLSLVCHSFTLRLFFISLL